LSRTPNCKRSRTICTTLLTSGCSGPSVNDCLTRSDALVQFSSWFSKPSESFLNERLLPVAALLMTIASHL
jgi:hypothetical protein